MVMSRGVPLLQALSRGLSGLPLFIRIIHPHTKYCIEGTLPVSSDALGYFVVFSLKKLKPRPLKTHINSLSTIHELLA
jgi:hypothetical protein